MTTLDSISPRDFAEACVVSTESGDQLPSVGVVVLSQGTRMIELNRCLDSVRAQQGVDLEILVVGNGWEPRGIGSGVSALGLPENLGAPEGRNFGAAAVSGELIFFIDDDAWIDDPHLLSRIAVAFAERPRLGSVQPHLCDADGTTMRRWVPRLRTKHPERPGPAFTIAEGICVLRREAFDSLGGWAGHFVFGHEGIDLAWRLWDAGWEVHYAGDLTAHHPATDPKRHSVFYRHNARNRVWTARRNLPATLIPIYLGVWTFITTARLIREPRALRTWLGGFVEGWRTDAGQRFPMKWSTVRHLARLGHPPVI
jgi:GT2 family glycosyltransferase